MFPAIRVFALSLFLPASFAFGDERLAQPPSSAPGSHGQASGTDGVSPLAERLRAHVLRLAGEIGERNVWRPQALHAAAGYIRDQWQRQGHTVTAQGYTAYEVHSENLEITLGGTPQPSQIIVVGAHYDSVRGSPGANDNASGVAALLEIGRMLKDAGLRRTLRLVAFVNEEPPFFFWGEMGSGVYARAARKRGDDIRLMIALEMLGAYSDAPGSQRYPLFLGWFYPDRANFIAFVSNVESRHALKRTVAAFRSVSAFPAESLAAPAIVPGVSWSDQLSFWREGYPAIMVTDTAFNRYPHYHTRQDTPEKIDYARMAQVVEGLAKTIVLLANDEEEP